MTEDQRAQPGQAPGGPDVEANTGQQPGAPGMAGRAPAAEPGIGAAGVAGTGVPDVAAEARVAELEARCAALQDQYLRAVAEVENVRRRGQEEVARANKFGIEAFAESLLPVSDSLELALGADDQSIEHMREGVEVTLRQLMVAFGKNRLKMIDPAGQKFDPNLHQAISVVPGDVVTPSVAPNHVVSVLQKGFLINDRVLRPALVTVAQP